MKINWIYKEFKDLLPQELYDILKLRQQIFVVEQHCPYLDADGKDPDSHHVLGYNMDQELICYSRIVLPGISYKEISIGRVVCNPLFRGQGLGKMLLTQSIKCLEETFGPVPIRIGAQAYLLNFYQSFGFEVTGPDGYFEDGILHYIMLRNAKGPGN